MTLNEARLPDVMIDLSGQYGVVQPRPSGLVINFNVVDENTTYAKAKAGLEALLTLHGIFASSLSITPGPEVKTRFNRNIKFGIATDLLM